MDYNQFTSYYRHPSFSNQYNLPPTALINRHMPSFSTQLPMGQQHLSKIGRKQFTNNPANKSSIQADNILKSPQRYPYQNRIALDKQYQRNLNTIDIQGASGGTLLSQAVRNKMKAREQLIRRQQQTQIIKPQELAIGTNVANQEQRRRQIAYEQYVKDQHVKKQNQTRLNNYQVQQNKTLQRNNNRYSGRRLSQDHHQQQQVYHINAKRSQSQRVNQVRNQLHQSIDVPELRNSGYQQRKPSRRNRNRNRGSSEFQTNYSTIDADSRRSEIRSNDNRKNAQQLNIQLPTDRKSLRLQNPTNLSSDGPIHLAALNIINGK